jgi:hypothetical protein
VSSDPLIVWLPLNVFDAVVAKEAVPELVTNPSVDICVELLTIPDDTPVNPEYGNVPVCDPVNDPVNESVNVLNCVDDDIVPVGTADTAFNAKLAVNANEAVVIDPLNEPVLI